MTTIPDHVGREAVRLLSKNDPCLYWFWPKDRDNFAVITVAELLMNPPAPMTDPDEEAAKRVLEAAFPNCDCVRSVILTRATEQMRKEREAWEAGR